MSKKTRLELTWIGKDERPKLEPRILLEDGALSRHAKARRSDDDIFDNILIHGDNLLALRALEASHSGSVKLVYIDPPYNTGSAFAHYDDGLEHSLWLSMIADRVRILHRLLREDGCFFVQADDNEAHYLKVICDEIFGRKNFISSFIWRKVDSPNDNKVPVTPDHEFIFGYAKDISSAKLNQRADESLLQAYRGPDDDGRFYRDRLLKKNGKNSLRTDRPTMYFGITDPDGTEIFPTHDDGREACWALGKGAVSQLIAEDKLIWKKRGEAGSERWVPYTREYAKESPTRPYNSIWTDLPTTRQTKSHQKEIFGVGNEFSTPKPEELIERLILMCTVEGDVVLDSFAGSGTTGAVAHKLHRRWIMAELGDHALTHIVPRLQQVIDGTDRGGVTEAVGWQGGGGFRFYTLAPSLLTKDRFGNWVVSKEYNAPMLAEALCSHLGFIYAPSHDSADYWRHGHSTETDFIYVTTQSLTYDALKKLSEEVGPNRTLLVCCKAYNAKEDSFPNLTVKKIPHSILSKCEWGRDDYSLRIANLPQASVAEEAADVANDGNATKASRPAAALPLFDSMGDE
ncbi:site-specific DNA-methyltransferase [Agrobacterium sp. AGB01]|uniref:site-specific DNA-methyltransferase n=1 Tax=Agrobacterium sp. AGB01 TaxID=2769302 RepID=UPI0017829EA8|nr:site-specific DNA-methyltransferase [Agrobacterium sp. AGB01]MBD9385683.1 site-specific DNA-methyltransferase [Agrobacterium sp. AGB01]